MSHCYFSGDKKRVQKYLSATLMFTQMHLLSHAECLAAQGLCLVPLE